MIQLYAVSLILNSLENHYHPSIQNKRIFSVCLHVFFSKMMNYMYLIYIFLLQLANSLPESVLMADMTAALLEHVGNTSQSYATILPCLRILSMLTEHDYGFFHLTM